MHRPVYVILVTKKISGIIASLNLLLLGKKSIEIQMNEIP